MRCHPDKGGDPVVFKKLNDAYNKLIGHIRKVKIQNEFLQNATLLIFTFDINLFTLVRILSKRPKKVIEMSGICAIYSYIYLNVIFSQKV